MVWLALEKPMLMYVRVCVYALCIYVHAGVCECNAMHKFKIENLSFPFGVHIPFFVPAPLWQ